MDSVTLYPAVHSIPESPFIIADLPGIFEQRGPEVAQAIAAVRQIFFMNMGNRKVQSIVLVADYDLLARDGVANRNSNDMFSQFGRILNENTSLNNVVLVATKAPENVEHSVLQQNIVERLTRLRDRAKTHQNGWAPDSGTYLEYQGTITAIDSVFLNNNVVISDVCDSGAFKSQLLAKLNEFTSQSANQYSFATDTQETRKLQYLVEKVVSTYDRLHTEMNECQTGITDLKKQITEYEKELLSLRDQYEVDGKDIQSTRTDLETCITVAKNEIDRLTKKLEKINEKIEGKEPYDSGLIEYKAEQVSELPPDALSIAITNQHSPGYEKAKAKIKAIESKQGLATDSALNQLRAQELDHLRIKEVYSLKKSHGNVHTVSSFKIHSSLNCYEVAAGTEKVSDGLVKFYPFDGQQIRPDGYCSSYAELIANPKFMSAANLGELCFRFIGSLGHTGTISCHFEFQSLKSPTEAEKEELEGERKLNDEALKAEILVKGRREAALAKIEDCNPIKDCETKLDQLNAKLGEITAKHDEMHWGLVVNHDIFSIMQSLIIACQWPANSHLMTFSRKDLYTNSQAFFTSHGATQQGPQAQQSRRYRV